MRLPACLAYGQFVPREGGLSVNLSIDLTEPARAERTDLLPARLYEDAVRRGEGVLTQAGALSVTTGQHTGRSAQDKFIVEDSETASQIWWENTRAMTPAHFAALKRDMEAYAGGKDVYVQNLYANADPRYRLPVRVITQHAWQALFIRNLLVRPVRPGGETLPPPSGAGLTILCLPGFAAEPERHGTRSKTVIALNLTGGEILIGGTSYAGEIKKSVFSFLNYRLPEKSVMPMHCSVNIGAANDPAIFFGLSGTGKTTLSADPARRLVGDDEHGWSQDGLFNFEGGCYAKMINLSASAEPQIFAAVNRFGAVLENVVLDSARRPDFADAGLAENSRGAYPLDFIPGIEPSGTAPHPRSIIMLTADAFGVLPPLARLTPEQAMAHFLSGYTAKIAGTEKGVNEPEATFSACFGAPFMPRPPSVYGALLREKISRHKTQCWLVNTGWTGGPYGVGQRMPIAATRSLLASALSGALAHAPMRKEPYFGLLVPEAAPNCDSRLLDPRGNWQDAGAYDAMAQKLQKMFAENFRQFAGSVSAEIAASIPA